MTTYTRLKGRPLQNKNCNWEIYQSCNYINRVIDALRFYQSLDMKNTESNARLMQYCNEEYPSMLNDYIHLITKHNEHLEAIHESVTSYEDLQDCDVSDCKFIERHHRNRNSDKSDDINTTNPDDKTIEYYKDLFGTIHCYLFHSFDVGLRLKSSELNMETDETNNNEVESSYYDQAFSSIQQAMIKRTPTFNKLSDFERLNNNHKFEIGIDINEEDAKQSDGNEIEPGITFTDGLLSHIENNIKSKEKVGALQKFLYQEGYDTDTIIQDTNGLTSNIYEFLKNQHISMRINQYIHSTQGRITQNYILSIFILIFVHFIGFFQVFIIIPIIKY